MRIYTKGIIAPYDIALYLNQKYNVEHFEGNEDVLLISKRVEPELSKDLKSSEEVR